MTAGPEIDSSHGDRPQPRATYRLQLQAGFGFRDALELVPYLRDLGISHLYLSPSMAARPGSTHGYDAVDPNRISDELGGEAAFRELCAAGLGVLLDIVPNHLAVDDHNPWWADEAERAKVFDWDPATGWYRRFFDIDDLAGVRQEDPEVFTRTHRKLAELLADGTVDGLRVDHPDGLADPAGYLERLRDIGADRVWVEKILHPGEALRPWPVAGTTGYEFLVAATALYVDPAAEAPLTALYAELTGETREFAEVAAEAEREMATGPFAQEVTRLAELARGLTDLPADVVEPVIADAVASLPTYRTYVDPTSGTVTAADRVAIAEASMPQWLADALLLDAPASAELVTRFQQTTPPVTAKGIEDTACYRYDRLLALNEVGGDPGRFGLAVEAFHAANVERQERFPTSLLAATTHDTMRSLDVRARLTALTSTSKADGGDSLHDRFANELKRWFDATESLVVDGVPGPNERWYLFQTLIGAWPIDPDRLHTHVEKAFREAKVHTSWTEPDEAWEATVQAFARAVVDLPPFAGDPEWFLAQVRHEGELAALGQTILRATAPGVPDTYQGDEGPLIALVDPDNRRPVDWAPLRERLAGLLAGDRPTAETRKLHVLHRALDLRRRRPEPFAGAYTPLDAGPHTVAYTRGADDVAVVVALRPDGEATVGVPPGSWRDVLRDEEVAVGEVSLVVSAVTAPWRVALLERM